MKILMVSSQLSCDGKSGGAGLYVYNLARELTHQGHYVDLIATVDPSWPADTGLTVYNLEISKVPAIRMLKWSISAFICSMKLTGKNEYDVIHVHHPQSRLYPLMCNLRIPMIASMHTGYALSNPRHSYQRRIVEFLIDVASFRKFRKIIMLNQYSQFQFLRWGISREKLQYVPNGVNCGDFRGKKRQEKFLQRLGVPQGVVVALCVSRLTKGKGIETLVDAWRTIQTSVSKPVWAVVVGDGPLKKILESKANDIPNIVFTGSIDYKDLLSAYVESDLFVMPSEGGEGMPTVLLQAMAAGLAIVATRIPGNMEIITADFGRLVVPGDPQQLAIALLELINDPISLRRMKSRAILISKKFDWKGIAASIVGVYASCQETTRGLQVAEHL